MLEFPPNLKSKKHCLLPKRLYTSRLSRINFEYFTTTPSQCQKDSCKNYYSCGLPPCFLGWDSPWECNHLTASQCKVGDQIRTESLEIGDSDSLDEFWIAHPLGNSRDRLGKIRVGSLSATQAHNSEFPIFTRLNHGFNKDRTSESLDWLSVFQYLECTRSFVKSRDVKNTQTNQIETQGRT